jgi:site-specific DNA-methyltransferase (adenine-specific)
MRYLIKLVTPPGGTVLDPFTGSGSTGKAALLDGFHFVGVELTEEYLPIIEGRLRWANEQEETDERLF